MSHRVRSVPLVALAVVVGLAIAMLPATAGAACPNEEIRAEQGSERLPDCRAFELVTPENKADNSTIEHVYGFSDGKHVLYESELPLPGSASGSFQQALATRTESGWVTTSLAPHAGAGEPIGIFTGESLVDITEVAFAKDFGEAFVDSPFHTDPLDETRPPAGSGSYRLNAYRLDVGTGSWSLAALPDSGPLTMSMAESGTYIAGVSEDGSHVLFETEGDLPTAPGTATPTEPEQYGVNNLYDRTGGHTYLVSVLPDNTPAPCGDLGDGPNTETDYSSAIYGALAPDGSNVVFTDWHCGNTNAPAHVYLREDDSTPAAKTVQLPGEYFTSRSSDGSKIFTADLYAERYNVQGVYEYDIASGVGTTISTEGLFVAASADGSRVYYVTGSGLYLWENGRTELLTTAGTQAFDPEALRTGTKQPGTLASVAVATPDGGELLFVDRGSLTSYNNYGPTCDGIERQSGGIIRDYPGDCLEAYVYKVSTKSFTCLSCNPTGAPPLGNTYLLYAGYNGLAAEHNQQPTYSQGALSPGGSRAFFQTEDALVPQDTNGLMDVYEWENGRVFLISSGQGTFGSYFDGAGSGGSDVYFETSDRDAPQDSETSTAIYDARADGGFPYRPFTSGCDSGQCQGPQTPAPSFGAPASATFAGVGNPVAAPTSAPVAKKKAKPKPKHKRKAKGRKAARHARKDNGERKGRK